jgi:PhzF family phenazine biosynthesis protein
VSAGVPLLQIDAFAAGPFTGNPAAVCLLSAARDDAWMQSVAAEMNLAETAFLVSRAGDGWDLRWFTPTVEVDLCGHATLASAHALWETGRLAADAVARFHTRSGVLSAARRGEIIELDFPSEPASEAPAPTGLVEGLGVTPVWAGRNRMDVLVQLARESDVRELEPDLTALGRIATRGIIVTSAVTAEAPGEYDFISRFFAPAAGVPEDPVTGSAHCCLAPFWAERLGRMEMTGWQASRRGGAVRVRVAGDRVKLGGQAVTVLRGELVA